VTGQGWVQKILLSEFKMVKFCFSVEILVFQVVECVINSLSLTPS
jgi:hypothetical protein